MKRILMLVLVFVGVSFNFVTARAENPQMSEVDRFLTLTNDRDVNSSDLTFTLGADGKATGLRYISHVATQSNSKDFTFSQLSSGAVLEEHQNIKALILIGQVDPATTNAALTFRFINNGLTGKYKECQAIARQDSNGDWRLYSPSGTEIQTAKIITWNLGIQTLQGLCP